MLSRIVRWVTTPQSSQLIEKRNFQLVQLDAFGVGLSAAANAFLAVFLTRLGASTFQISLLSSMPAVAGLALVMVLGWLIQRQKNPAPWYSKARFSVQLCYLITGLVPFFFVGEDKINAVLIVWALATIPQTILNITFNVVMNAMAGPEGRYEFMTHRWTVLGITNSVVTFIVGQLLAASSYAFPINYQIMFMVLSLGGIASFIATSNFIVPDNPPRPIKSSLGFPKRVQSTLSLIRNQRGFFAFVSKRFVFMFGMTITGPLFPLYFVRVANMADSWIAAITTAASAVIIFSYFIWTHQVHKRSSRFVLLWTTFGLSLFPILVSMTIEPWMIIIYAGLAGLFQGGLDLVFFDELMKTVPVESAATFISFAQGLNYVSSILAPVLASILADSVGIGPTLLIAGFLRLAGFGLFLIKPPSTNEPEPSPGAHPHLSE